MSGVADPLEAVKLDPVLTEAHEPIVDEVTWLMGNVSVIEDEGAEPYLRNLLFTLAGGFPTSDTGRSNAAAIAALLVNPFYAIELDPAHAERSPSMSEEEWIECNVAAIAELGAEGWLLRLLATLKGDPEPGVPTVGRNELCPCGSGRKYKHCHGR
jgi:SEC-C motif-containing protein